MGEESAEKATFYISPAVISIAQPGPGEGLSDGPHDGPSLEIFKTRLDKVLCSLL